MFQSRNDAELFGGRSDQNLSRRRDRVLSAKRAFTTRRANFRDDIKLLRDGVPHAGDLVLARVRAIGQHPRLESCEGRRIQLYEGDEIIVAYGARYAPDQFEAVVPDDLDECDLVAGGGVAAKVLSKCTKMARATRIEPIGLIGNSGGLPINLAHFALPTRPILADRPRVIAVAGTSMNAGKTTTAAALTHGLNRAGLRVAATKVTGTGSGGDLWSMIDAGAVSVLDFTDMGHASTAGLPIEQVEMTALSLIAHSAATQADAIVVEVADGLLQRETAALLASPLFRGAIDGVIFACGDAMGALTGRERLVRHGHNVMALSGMISASPLASREAEEATKLPVLTLEQLRDPVEAPKIVFATDVSIDVAA